MMQSNLIGTGYGRVHRIGSGIGGTRVGSSRAPVRLRPHGTHSHHPCSRVMDGGRRPLVRSSTIPAGSVVMVMVRVMMVVVVIHQRMLVVVHLASAATPVLL